MKNSALQINETSINESFKPINDLLEEFRTFSSNLFSQIIDWFTPMLQSLIE